MDERRIAPRATCRLNCRIHLGKKRILARVVDVSEGGLCFYSPVRVDSKTLVQISIDVPGLSDSIVKAQVWHVRQQRIQSSARRVWVVGVMLAESDDAYLRLLMTAGLTPDAQPAPLPERPEPIRTTRPKPRPAAAAKPPPRPLPPPRSAEIEAKIFRVRVQARTGPRTRLLTFTANSTAQAREMAIDDLTPEWKIIEVLAAS